MNYYFAPMEGLTDSIYRRVHHAFFPGVDRYFTPFFSPTVHRYLTGKEKRELPPAREVPFPVVPQVLTKNAEDFLWMASVCRELGYDQVNLNLGCPSGTVVAKGKGSGMLANPDTLDAFLERIFSAAPLPISVKTRIGMESEAEFSAILDVLSRYPIAELIIHPRLRRDFYDGGVRMDSFRMALERVNCPLCFNGNLCTPTQIRHFQREFPAVGAVMLGRGLIGDPGMLSPGGTSRDNLREFHAALLEEYLVAFGGSRNAMFRLKENWRYLLCHFRETEKLGKRLRKTTDLAEYRAITADILSLPMLPELNPDW